MGLSRLIRSNSAVSEVMGTILLLMINVGLFSVVAISVFNFLPFTPAPSADIICQVNGDSIILTHRGGDELSLGTKIGFSNNTGIKYIVVGDYLDAKSKEDGKWSVGEQIVYSNINLLDNKIQVTIIDPSSNSFILSTKVTIINSITVTTLDATAITINSAKLLMNYDLRAKSGSVRFTYRPSDGDWINTSWISRSKTGSYTIVISSLSPMKLYYFKAQLLYNSTILEGEQKSFTTLVIPNNPPTVTTPNPTNGSTGIPITTALLSITIQDPEGDSFNWTISTSPNIGSNIGSNTNNGTKTCTVAGLAYLTTYTWTVKAYDGHHWTNRSYVFVTGICLAINTSVNMISPYVTSVNPLTITAVGNSDLDNVSLYYRWSDDNISWNGGLNEIYDSIDSNTSNVDGSGDVGTELNFPNAKGIVRDGNSMTLQEQNKGIMAAQEWLNCNALGSTYAGWTRTGTTPYVNVKDYPSNYVYTASNGAQIGWFDFPSTTLTGTLSVNISIYCQNVDGGGDDGADVFVDYTGSGSGINVGRVGQHNAWQYDTINLGAHTISEVNNLRVYLQYYKSSTAHNVLIDLIRIGVSQPTAPNYQLDFEFQWTAAVYNRVNKQVCFYVASHTGGTENLLVNYRNGSIWSSLGTITTTGWSNFTATGLTSSLYTIQLKGATESGDLAQDSWNIDLIMLHTWNTTGGLHGQNWIIWPNALNPDISSPWSWSFNFPKGAGYYEFYSIGNDIGHCGGDIEPTPASADARSRHT
jgi:hypothetical protein